MWPVIADVQFNRAGSQDMAGHETVLVVNDADLSRERGDDFIKLHEADVVNCPLETGNIGDLDQSFDSLEGNSHAGPERVVDDQSNIDRVHDGIQVLVKIPLGMCMIERRRDLDIVRTKIGGSLGQFDQFSRAGRLSTHGDRDASVGCVDHGLTHPDTFGDGHRGEVTCCSAGEEDPGTGLDATIDKELYVLGGGLEIQLQTVIVKHRRYRYIATAQFIA